MTGAFLRPDSNGAAQRSLFGTLPDGRPVEAITLANARGMSATILTYGATLQALLVPDRDGCLADVVLGHGTLAPYLAAPQYFGATVGRVANRIAGGRFHLDGTAYAVQPNDGPSALHGGQRGFDKANWQVAEIDATAVSLAHVSPDGDQGFPGTLDTRVTYRLSDTNDLHIEYAARTDRPTIVNITNHAYWNLAGEGAGTAMDHRLQIFGDHFLPTDANAIPTGEFRSVADTPFDFRQPTPVGARLGVADEQIRVGHGYDHNWVLLPSRDGACRPVARLEEPVSGRILEIWSDQPGLQFYSGNFLDGSSVGKSGHSYQRGDAVALEPQQFPDTPNQPAFGSIRLAPGDIYRHRMILHFRVGNAG